jgi:hypothetical protein
MGLEVICLLIKQRQLKKKPINYNLAIQTNNTESLWNFIQEVVVKVHDDSDKSDTTIFNKETIGEITYDVEGAFNLQSMEF